MNNRMYFLGMALVLASVFFASARPVYATTRYVDDSNTSGPWNGQSWATAYRYLQDALDASAQWDVIKVAQGTYHPDEATSGHSGGQAEFFQLAYRVTIEGGYRGAYDLSGLDPSHRDPSRWPSILSGDLNGDDQPGFVNYEGNAYCVVNASGVDEFSVLDGFTITGGNGGAWNNGDGAGIYVYGSDSSPTIGNCRIVSNRVEGGLGGGAWVYEGWPLIENCTFAANRAGDGGGMYLQISTQTQFVPLLTKCTFVGNVATGVGGALSNRVSAAMRIQDCTFLGNQSRGTAQYDGGGAAVNDADSNALFINCLFSGNRAFTDGGAVLNRAGSTVELLNCTLSANVSHWGKGGGVFAAANGEDSSTTLTNCILWGNSDYDQASLEYQQIWFDGLPEPDATYTCIEGLSMLADPTNIDDDPQFGSPAGPDGEFGTIDDNLRLVPYPQSPSPCVGVGDNSAVPQYLFTA